LHDFECQLHNQQLQIALAPLATINRMSSLNLICRYIVNIVLLALAWLIQLHSLLELVAAIPTPAGLLLGCCACNTAINPIYAGNPQN
jgi:hypothetical protein